MASQTLVEASSTSSYVTSYDDPTIQSLAGVAESLLSSIFPSGTSTDVASSTSPEPVVVDSATYTVASGSSTLSTTTVGRSLTSKSTRTPARTASIPTTTATSNESEVNTNRSVALGLGVGLGSAAFILLLVLVWLLHRPHVRSPGHKYQSTSAFGSDVQTRRGPVTYSSNVMKNYDDMQAAGPPATAMATRLASDSHRTAQPGHQQTFEPWNGDNVPFYTSYGPSPVKGSQDEMQRLQTSTVHELHGKSSMRVKSSPCSAQPASRPENQASTPDMPGSPNSPIDHMDGTLGRVSWPRTRQSPGSGQYQDEYIGESSPLGQPSYTNPFISDEDFELEAPILMPVRSPRRTGPPTIYHAPRTEVASFDFDLGTCGSREEM